MNRCRALAQAIDFLGGACSFASTHESYALLPEDATGQFDLIEVSADASALSVGRQYGKTADWLIVDHYGVGFDFEHSARDWAKFVLAIDDRPSRRHDCDLLLDQNQGDAEIWRGLLRGGATVLAGPSYALLKGEILDAKKERQAEKKHFVLTLGASDPHHTTARLIPAISGVLPGDCVFDVIAGPANTQVDQLKEICETHGAVLHHAPSDIAGIFARSTLAITAAGSTVWELAALGVPMIVLTVSADQEQVAASIAASGAAVLAEDAGAPAESCVARLIVELAGDHDRLSEMSQAGRRLVDGQGSRRVAREMFDRLEQAGAL